MNPANPFESPAALATKSSSNGFAPILISRSFKFLEHKPTRDIIFTGAAIISVEGLILVPESKQTATAQALSTVFGLVGYIIARFMRSTDKIEWPIEPSDSYEVESTIS